MALIGGVPAGPCAVVVCAEAPSDYAAEMGWFSRKAKDTSDTSSQPDTTSADGDPVDELVERPFARPLTATEKDRITAALQDLEAQGVDVDDLDALGAAYDAACARRSDGTANVDPKESCEMFAIAIGEHLARHSTLAWGIVTDVFGTDLGLSAAKSESVVVPHNLVSARWMRGETGWVPRVVRHLLSINARD